MTKIGEVLNHLPESWVKKIVLPVLLILLAGAGAYVVSGEKSWRSGQSQADKQQDARIRTLEFQMYDMHRDVLEFQASVYEQFGMEARERATRRKLERLPKPVENQGE